VKHLLTSNPRPHHVIATSRSLGGEGSKELEELAAKESCLSVLQLDVDNYIAFPTLAKEVGGIVKENGLNVLVNNAGIHIRKGLEDVMAEDMTDIFHQHNLSTDTHTITPTTTEESR